MMIEHKSLTQPTLVGWIDYGWKTGPGKFDYTDLPTIAIAVDRSRMPQVLQWLQTHGLSEQQIETSDNPTLSRPFVVERGIVIVYVQKTHMPVRAIASLRRKDRIVTEWVFNEQLWNLPTVPDEERIEPFVPSEYQLVLPFSLVQSVEPHPRQQLGSGLPI